MLELLDSKKEQLFNNSSVDPAVSCIQKPSYYTEGHSQSQYSDTRLWEYGARTPYK